MIIRGPRPPQMPKYNELNPIINIEFAKTASVHLKFKKLTNRAQLLQNSDSRSIRVLVPKNQQLNTELH